MPRKGRNGAGAAGAGANRAAAAGAAGAGAAGAGAGAGAGGASGASGASGVGTTERIPEFQRGWTFDQRVDFCVRAIVHASKCTDDNCTYLKCSHFKRFAEHRKTCRGLRNGTCAMCKKSVLVCMTHSKTCRDRYCEVPFCLSTRINCPHLIEGSSRDDPIDLL